MATVKELTERVDALENELSQLRDLALTTAKFTAAVDAIVTELDGDFEGRWLFEYGKWETGTFQKIIDHEVRVNEIATSLVAIGQMLWDWHEPLPDTMRDEIKRRLVALGFERRQRGIPLAT